MAKEENIILPVLTGVALLALFSSDNKNSSGSGPAPDNLTPTQFILRYWNEAKLSQAQTTVPALFTITQAGLESGWGKHAPQFNFFGIKASPGWTGATQLLDTTEYINNVLVHVKASFRAYPSARAAFIDHGNFFLVNQRYHAAMQQVNDIIKFTNAIAAAGYATDPNYASKLIASMKIVVQVLKVHKLI